MKKLKELLKSMDLSVTVLALGAPMFSFAAIGKLTYSWVIVILLWAATLSPKFIGKLMPRGWHQLIGYCTCISLLCLSAILGNPDIPYYAAILFFNTILIDCFVYKN